MKIYTIAYLNPEFDGPMYLKEKYIAQNEEEAIAKFRERHKNDVYFDDEEMDDDEEPFDPIKEASIADWEDVYE